MIESAPNPKRNASLIEFGKLALILDIAADDQTEIGAEIDWDRDSEMPPILIVARLIAEHAAAAVSVDFRRNAIEVACDLRAAAVGEIIKAGALRPRKCGNRFGKLCLPSDLHFRGQNAGLGRQRRQDLIGEQFIRLPEKKADNDGSSEKKGRHRQRTQSEGCRRCRFRDAIKKGRHGLYILRPVPCVAMAYRSSCRFLPGDGKRERR